MKKILFIALVLTFITACKKANKCGEAEITTFVELNDVKIIVSNAKGNAFDFVELEYGPRGFKPGTGTLKEVVDGIELVNMPKGIYEVYARGNCSGQSFTELSGPKTFIVNNAIITDPDCFGPTYLTVSGEDISNVKLEWLRNGSNYDELAYGLQGFDPDTAQHIFCNTTVFTDFVLYPDLPYDFYVRGSCPSGAFTDWSTVKTYKPIYGHNVCIPPVEFTTVKDAQENVVMVWAPNGAKKWELSFNRNSNDPNGLYATKKILTTNSYTMAKNGLSYNSNYYAFVRAICDDGSTTAWLNATFTVEP